MLLDAHVTWHCFDRSQHFWMLSTSTAGELQGSPKSSEICILKVKVFNVMDVRLWVGLLRIEEPKVMQNERQNEMQWKALKTNIIQNDMSRRPNRLCSSPADGSLAP